MKYTSPACRPCHVRKAARWASANPEKLKAKKRPRRSTDVLQKLTAPTAHRMGEPYTEADYVILRDPGLSHFGKALRLHRTYKAVKSQCFRAGIRSERGVLDFAEWRIHNPNAERIDEITAALRQEFETAGVPFPAWDWDDEDLKETA